MVDGSDSEKIIYPEEVILITPYNEGSKLKMTWGDVYTLFLSPVKVKKLLTMANNRLVSSFGREACEEDYNLGKILEEMHNNYDQQSKFLKNFFENSLKISFQEEILNAIKVYGGDTLITYNETALLSLLSGALIRLDGPQRRITALQEYLTYDEEGNCKKKRADLFVTFRGKENLYCDIIVEAKQLQRYKHREENKETDKSYYYTTMQQAEQYIEGQSICPALCVTLYFEHLIKIQDHLLLEKYRKMELPELKDCIPYSFEIEARSFALFVYGYIKCVN
jgi:hypothetical protein